MPAAAGQPLAGLPGRLYAKRLTDFDGHGPVPFWRARTEVEDTRLRPGEGERREYVFGAEARKVRVRLLYRRFWWEVMQSKGWPDETVTAVERTIRVRD